MGKSKSTSSSSGEQNTTTTASPSAWEQSFNPTLLNMWNQAQPMISGVTGAGGSLAQALLSGSQLPGAYSGTSGLGATPYGIDQNAQNAIVNESMRSIPTSLQGSGMLDSGASQALYARGAQNVLSNVAQFNTGAQQSAMGMGSQIGTASMQPAFSSASMLASLLPGLRSINQNTTMNQQSQTTSQQPLAQTIGQLSQAFGGNVIAPATVGSGANAMAGGNFTSTLAQMLGGQKAQTNSMAGTVQGGNLGADMADKFGASQGGQSGGSGGMDPQTMQMLMYYLPMMMG